MKQNPNILMIIGTKIGSAKIAPAFPKAAELAIAMKENAKYRGQVIAIILSQKNKNIYKKIVNYFI
jgi:hypothetical protein